MLRVSDSRRMFPLSALPVVVCARRLVSCDRSTVPGSCPWREMGMVKRAIHRDCIITLSLIISVWYLSPATMSRMFNIIYLILPKGVLTYRFKVWDKPLMPIAHSQAVPRKSFNTPNVGSPANGGPVSRPRCEGRSRRSGNRAYRRDVKCSLLCLTRCVLP